MTRDYIILWYSGDSETGRPCRLDEDNLLMLCFGCRPTRFTKREAQNAIRRDRYARPACYENGKARIEKAGG